MALRLEKRTLDIEKIVSEGHAQPVVEGSLELPSGLPPIGRVLKVKAKPEVLKVEPSDDRALVEGVIHFSLLYTALEEASRYAVPEDDDDDAPHSAVQERLVHASWQRGLSFTYLLELPGASDDHVVNVKAVLHALHYEVSRDERGLEVDVVLDLTGKVKEYARVTLSLGAVGADVIQETEQVRLRSYLGEGYDREQITAVLGLGGRSTPENVLKVQAHAIVDDVISGEGYVGVRGHLNCAVLYEGAEGAGVQSAEWHRAATFDMEVPIERVGPDARADVSVHVKVRDYRIEETEEGWNIVADIDLVIEAAAYRIELVSCLTGLTGETDEIAARTEELELYEAVGETQARSDLNGVLEIPEGYPPIERLLQGDAQVHVQDVHVLGDKVAVEGTISVNALYVGRGDMGDGEVYSVHWPDAINFDIEIQLPGAEPGLDRHVDASVRKVEFDLINRHTLEVRVQLDLDVAVGRAKVVSNVVEAVVVPPEDPDPATFTFVVVQEDDSLWKLSQVYRTTVADLLANNEWLEEGTEPPVGSKLCIPGRKSEGVPVTEASVESL